MEATREIKLETEDSQEDTVTPWDVEGKLNLNFLMKFSFLNFIIRCKRYGN